MDARVGRMVLELKCVLGAPRERIFRSLTEPAELAKWWGPQGFTTPEIDLDLRVGGHYRFGMQPADGDLFHLSGEYLEIHPPSRLVYTFRWEEPDPDDRGTVVTAVSRRRPIRHGGVGLPGRVRDRGAARATPGRLDG